MTVAVSMVSSAAANSLADAGGDGRHARRDRNRLAVVDAMLQLYAQGNLAPTTDEIADRAGLSPRSLFRYFDDLDDLVRVAIERQHHRLLPVTEIAVTSDAPFDQRLLGLVAQRLALYQQVGSVGVIARVRAPFQPLIAAELTLARSFLRRQIEQLFAPELCRLGSRASAQAVAAIDVLTSFESLLLLHTDQRLTPGEVHATLVGTVSTLLGRTE